MLCHDDSITIRHMFVTRLLWTIWLHDSVTTYHTFVMRFRITIWHVDSGTIIITCSVWVSVWWFVIVLHTFVMRFHKMLAMTIPFLFFTSLLRDESVSICYTVITSFRMVTWHGDPFAMCYMFQIHRRFSLRFRYSSHVPYEIPYGGHDDFITIFHMWLRDSVWRFTWRFRYLFHTLLRYPICCVMTISLQFVTCW